jgi:RNA ligase (TIGR02306 family)
MRKLATIRQIEEINSIPDADSIVVATVGGWKVVIRKGEFQVGDLAIFCEIDSWVPYELAPFLSKGQEPRVYNGIKGQRLKSIRLRGQISQGLLLNLDSVIPTASGFAQEGQDVTDILKIQKWEPPVPANLAGEVKGMFPSKIPKTDQERIQNLVDELEAWKQAELTWEITEKLDGCSMTAYLINGEFGVCSRNYDLKPSDKNSLWNTAISQHLEAALRTLGDNVALQGELIGEGIQGNPYKLKGQQFYLYDVYDIVKGRYFFPADRQQFARNTGMNHVPIVSHEYKITESVTELLLMAEGNARLSNVKVEREGLVFKCETNPSIHFKSISNIFLLKNNG